uniref:Uncharacterized protein n=1 Tax=Octopus bimaculoides TaxID=37653 RepID=A0A0L8IHH1_OCTBM
MVYIMLVRVFNSKVTVSTIPVQKFEDPYNPHASEPNIKKNLFASTTKMLQSELEVPWYHDTMLQLCLRSCNWSY